MMKKHIYLFVLIFLIAGCQESAVSVKPEVGEEFSIRFGEELIVQEEELKVQFSDLLEESRCPEGVACVWSGNAEISVQFNDEKLHLNTHVHPERDTASQFQIQLVSLDPYPIYQQEFQKKEYVAHLLITRVE